jgi:hypothetical protein
MSETFNSGYRKLVSALVEESEPVEQGRSLVVVLGINEYVHWQTLKNAVQDARSDFNKP